MELEISGPTPGTQYDRITNIDTVAIDGLVELTFGYSPTAGTVFDFLDFATFSGGFDPNTQVNVIGFNAALLDFTSFTTNGQVTVLADGSQVAVPEPNSFALLAIAAAPFVLRRRRVRRRSRGHDL